MAIQFIEFIPSREEFEMTEHARGHWNRFYRRDGDHVRFIMPSNEPAWVKEQGAIPLNGLGNICECWYEDYVLPDLAGRNALHFLVVKSPTDIFYHIEDRWFHKVEVPDALLGLL